MQELLNIGGAHDGEDITVYGISDGSRYVNADTDVLKNVE